MMDTKTRKRKAAGTETPKGISFSSKRSELLVKSYTKANTSPLKLATKQEMEAREDDEVCTKHGNPIVAFEEKDGSTLCEECVFKGHVEKPIFTAVVTKQIKKAFDTEYSTFEKLCEELMSIKQNEVRNRIQESVTLYFDSIRDKIDELEEKTVAKIENSKNLNDLVGILEETHGYMEQNCVAEKYDSERTKLDFKVSEVRYTYVSQRKQHYDETISEIERDNKKLADAVERASKMINAVYNCDRDEDKLQNTLNELISGMITIDEKHPDYNDNEGTERHDSKKKSLVQVEDINNIKQQELNFSQSEHKENWKAEEMKEGYFNKENTLCKREIDGNNVTESEVMGLKLHLQKVITVPSARSTRVFLMGGAKDSEGKQAINYCYEVNVSRKTMSPCDKLTTPKLSFAAAISPDAKNIYIAGGSTGENNSTNECEVFNTSRKKWSSLPALNQPRFSASLIVCENQDIYCFGGVDNDAQDPTKFSTLRSIETLNLSEEAKEWEVLKLSLPYKTSSPGAISLGHRAFIVFGGWNKTTLNNSVIVRSLENSDDYATEEAGVMAKEDTFVSNGLVSRNSETRETIIFGTSHVHQFNEGTKTFSIIE
jgi:ribosomal protein S17E